MRRAAFVQVISRIVACRRQAEPAAVFCYRIAEGQQFLHFLHFSISQTEGPSKEAKKLCAKKKTRLTSLESV